jgi:hypothetical protein
VCCSGKEGDRYHEKLKSSGMDFVTLDDFAFIFTQMQHNIGKWSMTYDAMQSGRIRAQIEEPSEMAILQLGIISITLSHGYSQSC